MRIPSCFAIGRSAGGEVAPARVAALEGAVPLAVGALRGRAANAFSGGALAGPARRYHRGDLSAALSAGEDDLETGFQGFQRRGKTLPSEAEAQLPARGIEKRSRH